MEVATLTNAAVVSGTHQRWQESVDNGLRAIELAAGRDFPLFRTWNSRWRAAMSALHMGDPDAARPHTLFMIDRAEERTTSRAAAGHGFAVATYLSFLEGDWNASRQYSDRGMERSPANPHLLMLRAVLEHETGDSAQGDIHLEHLLAAADRPGPVLSCAWGMATAAVARITAFPGRL